MVGRSKGQEQALVTSEIRIRRLRNQLDELRAMAIEAGGGSKDKGSSEPSAGINVIGEATSTDFRIDRGTNTSMRATDPFDEERVQDILSKVKIGSDLSVEQKAKITALIRKYAAVDVRGPLRRLVEAPPQH
jgi:hypothetical protein